MYVRSKVQGRNDKDSVSWRVDQAGCAFFLVVRNVAKHHCKLVRLFMPIFIMLIDGSRHKCQPFLA